MIHNHNLISAKMSAGRKYNHCRFTFKMEKILAQRFDFGKDKVE